MIIRQKKSTGPKDPWALANAGMVLGVGVAATAAIAMIGIFLAPNWAVLDATTEEAKGAIRDTAVRLATGVGAATAGVLAWGRLELSRREHHLSQQAQFTDRYSRAIEHVGASSDDTVVGGLYSLERLAADSPSDASTIAEVLAAFVREHATQDAWRALERPSTAVTAAVSILGRNQWPRPADLSGATLIGIDASSAAFSEARLLDADLSNSRLRGTDLSRANLSRCFVSEADLTGAELTDAYLGACSLEGAVLDEAQLSRADLRNAQMQDARLARTDLHRALLCNADLSRASFQGANLHEANLAGANLNGADLSMARLTGAVMAGADITNAALPQDRTDLDAALARKIPDRYVPVKVVFKPSTPSRSQR